MTHRCPDGQHTRLTREGPVGTMIGVTVSCPRCGYSRPAAEILADATRVLNDPRVRAALR